MTGAASGGTSGGATGRTTTEQIGGTSPAGLANFDEPQLPNVVDLKPMGQHGGATIYHATDLRLQRPVVIRVFSPLTDEADRARFNDDTKKLGRLSAHPNVATVYDAGFTGDDRPFLVSEALTATTTSPNGMPAAGAPEADGVTLAERLSTGGPLPWQEAVDIALQLCAGLGQAHRAGVLHRELSTSAAVLVGSTPKLTNFTISADRPNRGSALAPEALLHSAPETFGRSGPAVWDERTDLYSLSSILHELIDGRAPFWRPGDGSAEAIQLRVIHEKPPTLEQELVPVPLSVFIAAALSKDPLDRPQSADEFAHELRLIREGKTTGSTQSVLHGTTGSIPVIAPGALTFSSEPAPAAPLASSQQTVAAVPPPAPAPAPVSVPAPVDPAWPAPVDPSDAGDGNTAVYSDFMRPSDNVLSDQSSLSDRPGELIETSGSSSDDSPRSSAFMVAVAMVALGIIGLAALVAVSALGDDDAEQTAPVLPDPNAPATVVGIETDADGGSLVGAIADSDVMQDDADGATATTAAPADPMETTSTTIIRVQVPNLVGLKVESATKQLADGGFEVVVISRKSATAAPGTVAQQKPDAGARVALPITVTLYIPKVSNLPDMIGRSAESVCLELRALSLTCNQTMRFSDTAQIGSVISSDPVGGALFSDGSAVNLVVSRGPVTNVSIPSVTGLNRADAETALRAAGFIRISFSEATSENVDLGLAIGSSPGATSLLATDQPIVVSISTGPPAKARLPNVVGLDRAAAETQLTTLGYTVIVEMVDLAPDDVNVGKVTAMNPPADSDVATGSPVTLSVGQAMAAESTTTTTSTNSSSTDTTETSNTTSSTSSTSTTTSTTASTASTTSTSTTSSTTPG